jgi:hypothetical protein
MSRLKSDSELETARFRQAVYIEFCKNKSIPDHCGSQAGYERIIACFIEQLMLDHNSRSATLHGYVKVINTLFRLRHFDIPADLLDRTNMCFKIIHAREREENIARQRSPITRETSAALLDLAKKLIQLKLSLLTGSPSSESLACVALNMLRKRSQLSTSTNTLQVNVSLKPSSLLI